MAIILAWVIFIYHTILNELVVRCFLSGGEPMIGLIGLVLSLALLITLAYRGASVIVLAPLLAMFAAAFSGEFPLLATYTQIFMPALSGFLAKYFPLFLLGALFGKLMDESGCAESIASRISSTLGSRHAILAVVLSVAILTYGGVSLFVVAFAILPLANSVFRSADIPRRLIPATIALGSGTFTMTSLPGTMQIQNLIPMRYFNTTAFAAPVLGTIGGLCSFALGMLWLNRRARIAARHSEGFATAAGDGPGLDRRTLMGNCDRLPPFSLAIGLIASVLVCNFVFVKYWIPTWNTDYLAEKLFGSVNSDEIRGIWGIWSSVMALVVACLLLIVSSPRCRQRLSEIMRTGAMDSLLPVFNTASEVGYGATIAALPAFTVVKNALLNFVPNNPLVSEAAAVSVLAGITGSASGGLGIALESLGSTYHERAAEFGVDPDVMHRVASMASGGLDSLPHNGAVITLLLICGLTHKQSYFDIGVVTVVIPLISLALVIALASF
jgi:H+/gluconate symporter-like permease